MRIFRLIFRPVGVVLLALMTLTGNSAAAEEPLDTLKSVQGKWVRQVATPQGRVKLIKEHKGKTTTLTAYDEQDNVLYAHESDFKIEVSGKVRVFTFFNRQITAGPNAGRKIKEPASFVVRVSGNRFIEALGLLEDDPAEPLLILWDRLGNPPNIEEAA